jgi:hypothetical protein
VVTDSKVGWPLIAAAPAPDTEHAVRSASFHDEEAGDMSALRLAADTIAILATVGSLRR